jgi:hypothetical protein
MEAGGTKASTNVSKGVMFSLRKAIDKGEYQQRVLYIKQ